MRELIDVARTADVGIVSYIPSNLNNYLASPNKLFEYINAGLPVAASDIPFLRKTICDDDIGVVFDPNDPHSIAGSLNHHSHKGASPLWKNDCDSCPQIQLAD